VLYGLLLNTQILSGENAGFAKKLSEKVIFCKSFLPGSSRNYYEINELIETELKSELFFLQEMNRIHRRYKLPVGKSLCF